MSGSVNSYTTSLLLISIMVSLSSCNGKLMWEISWQESLEQDSGTLWREVLHCIYSGLKEKKDPLRNMKKYTLAKKKQNEGLRTETNYTTCKVDVEMPCLLFCLNSTRNSTLWISVHHPVIYGSVSCASEVPTRLTSAPLNTMGAPVRWCNSAATVARFARAKGTWDSTKQSLSISNDIHMYH